MVTVGSDTPVGGSGRDDEGSITGRQWSSSVQLGRLGPPNMISSQLGTEARLRFAGGFFGAPG
jgi:hypothetical protein